MRAIVGMAVVVLTALNVPSTAQAAGAKCVRLGWHPDGARGLVAVRQGERVVGCGGAVSTRSLTRVTAAGRGTLHTTETRVDGLLSVHSLNTGNVRSGGDADLPKLERRLDTTRGSVMKVRVLLATILIALALFAPRRAISGAAAAVAASVVLSALGSTSLTLLGVLTLLGSLVPWRALWLFFAAYLVVLVSSPATQSLALLGPHPWGGGRFYGVSNEIETLLLAPALVLGLAAAPLVLLTIAWSRAGADGGGLLVYLTAYARLLPRPQLALIAAAVLAVLFVAIDAATGGSSHVTHSVLHGHVFHDLWHRWHTSWNGVAGAWGRGIVSALSAGTLAWVATRRPRARIVDAFLLAVLVSLVANDTPQDVLFWGAINGVALWRAV
ncbi:MAG: hypothetical protein ACJ76I_08190 [Gaiellaceae bacterium]